MKEKEKRQYVYHCLFPRLSKKRRKRKRRESNSLAQIITTRAKTKINKLFFFLFHNEIIRRIFLFTFQLEMKKKNILLNRLCFFLYLPSNIREADLV